MTVKRIPNCPCCQRSSSSSSQSESASSFESESVSASLSESESASSFESESVSIRESESSSGSSESERESSSSVESASRSTSHGQSESVSASHGQSESASSVESASRSASQSASRSASQSASQSTNHGGCVTDCVACPDIPMPSQWAFHVPLTDTGPISTYGVGGVLAGDWVATHVSGCHWHTEKTVHRPGGVTLLLAWDLTHQSTPIDQWVLQASIDAVPSLQYTIPGKDFICNCPNDLHTSCLLIPQSGFSENLSGSSTLNVTVPPGFPVGQEENLAGNLLLLFMVQVKGAHAFTTPTGWTPLIGFTSASNYFTVNVCYRIATGTFADDVSVPPAQQNAGGNFIAIGIVPFIQALPTGVENTGTTPGGTMTSMPTGPISWVANPDALIYASYYAMTLSEMIPSFGYPSDLPDQAVSAPWPASNTALGNAAGCFTSDNTENFVGTIPAVTESLDWGAIALAMQVKPEAVTISPVDCEGSCSGSSSSSESESVSSASITAVTVTCCPNPIPPILFATFDNQLCCPCLQGLTVELIFNGSNWSGSSPDCSAFTVTLACEFNPDTGTDTWRIFVECAQGENINGPQPDTGGVQCDPFMLTWHTLSFGPAAHDGCCVVSPTCNQPACGIVVSE